MINFIKTSSEDEEFVKPKRSFCPKVINCDPYEGCEHACVYCVAIDHESDLLVAKENYPLVLEQFLDSSGNTHPVYVGSWTDVYQPAEEEARLTRETV